MSLFGFRNTSIRYGGDRTFDRSTIFPLGLVYYGVANGSRDSRKSPKFAGAVDKWRLVVVDSTTLSI